MTPLGWLAGRDGQLASLGREEVSPHGFAPRHAVTLVSARHVQRRLLWKRREHLEHVVTVHDPLQSSAWLGGFAMGLGLNPSIQPEPSGVLCRSEADGWR